jgi:hypothetical protein
MGTEKGTGKKEVIFIHCFHFPLAIYEILVIPSPHQHMVLLVFNFSHSDRSIVITHDLNLNFPNDFLSTLRRFSCVHFHP